MKVELSSKDIEAEIEIILTEGFGNPLVEEKELLQKVGFKGEQDETFLFAEKGKLFAGVSNKEKESLRSAIASAIRSISSTKYSTFKIDYKENIDAIVEGAILGSYSFDKYKSKKEEEVLRKLTIISSNEDELKSSTIISNATNFTRDIVNTPPEDCYPEILANIAQELASNNNLECKILTKKELEDEKMNTLLAVARASRYEPRVIHLTHKPKNPKAVISIVGKGLTYDSGGLSLKPSDFMVTMKLDKSGGSAVLGILKAVSELNLPIEVHGFVGAVENMIGGDAYKPDDVLFAKNGKTIEVRNTDAEGRLVLADVLGYAQQEVKADYIFDIATLTGAAVVGVGQYTSAIMGFNEELKEKLVKSAKNSGELASTLDFNRYLKKSLQSNIADICNISNTRYGGAITAGQFLSEFINKDMQQKWLHIDIAGPAFVEHTWGENPYGGSGASVRMVVDFIKNISN